MGGAAADRARDRAVATIVTSLLSLHVRRKAWTSDGPTVLDDIRLEVSAGEIVALLGPSGCGKTTLLRIIAGLDTHYEGHAAWSCGGRLRIGTVFQQPLLLPWRTVRENLRLVLPHPRLMPHAERLLAAMGLAGTLGLFPARLSLGMARRVAIVRALAIEPALLLLDEPFVSLDPAAAAVARDLVLATWRARPTAGILVTHDATEAAALADRVLLLSRNPGRVVGEIVIAEADRRVDAPEIATAVAAAIMHTRAATAA